MNTELWQKIQAFDFDQPMSEYNFSTRLAKENYWTKNFTATAIQEYKKFMYLAGTSDMMISPSGIVDIVWHHHLVFTNSYNELGAILQKNIQHIPSIHKRGEAEKFKLAKERTKKLYRETFGEMPREIWESSGMYESLELPKAYLKIREFLLIGILAFAAMIVPSYFLLRPLNLHLSSSDFFRIFGILVLCSFLGLEIFNQSRMSSIVRKFKLDVFLFKLTPLELVYLSNRKFESVVTDVINRMTKIDKVKVSSGKKLEIVEGAIPSNLEELQVLDVLQSGSLDFPSLTSKLLDKPVFSNVIICMEAFRKYFLKSKAFGCLYYVNFGILTSVFLFGFARLLTDVLREKAIDSIFSVLIVMAIVIGLYLWRLTNIFGAKVIPDLYRNQLIPTGKQMGQLEDWQFFLLGSTILIPALIPVVQKPAETSSSCGSSGTDSSCGSSCSSCGGCGD